MVRLSAHRIDTNNPILECTSLHHLTGLDKNSDAKIDLSRLLACQTVLRILNWKQLKSVLLILQMIN